MAFSLFKIIKGLLISEENTLTPKEIEIIPSGTAGTKTSVVSSQTSNQTITLPNATDTLVGKATTDILTNKTFDADGTGNSISNIENADIKAAAAIDATKIADGSVTNTEYQYLGGVTSDIQTQLNTNATGLSDHLSDTTDAHDASAISNVPAGNLAATDVQGALNELQTDVDSRALDSALTAHTGASTGVHGVTGAVVGTTDTQTLTNKTLTAPVIATIVSGAGTSTLPTSTDTLVGRATTDTLTNKTISGASNTITNVSLTTGVTGTLPIANGGTGQTAQTAAFDALAPTTTKADLITRDSTNNIRLAVGTDGQVLVADSAQASGLKWGQISGVKNYILNDGAESNTTGWTTYADAAASRPVDGTGGSPNVTYTRTTAIPLRGIASFQLVKDAANRQGQGFSYDFSVDRADQAKVMQIQFDYEIFGGTYSGGTSSTDSDMIVYIYDVTNARLIEPSPIKLDGSVNGVKYKCNATFQTNSNSTSYRLIVHCATTSAVTYSVQFDGFVVGPQIVTQGALVGDWKDYSLTIGAITTPPTKGTIVYDKAQWRRVGDSMEIRYDYAQSAAGSAGSGDYLFPLPTGYFLDTNKLTAFPNLNSQTLGATAVRVAGAEYVGIARIHDASNFKLLYNDTSSTTTIVSSSAGALNNTIIRYTFNVTVPILGWGTSQVLSSETDTRVVAALITGDPASATIGNPIIVPTISFDSHGSYNNTTGRYTCPLSGIYKIYGALQSASGATTLNVYKNAVSTSLAGSLDSNGEATFTTAISCNAGDIIDIRPGATVDATSMSLNFERLSGPAQVATSETVTTLITGDSASATSGNPIIIPTVIFDTHGAYNATTGRYTCPVAGFYQMYGAGSSASSATTLSIYKNAASYALVGNLDSNGEASFTGQVQCVAGDIIDLRPGGTVDFTSASLSITRLK